ncbi:MAG: isoprenyl transferase [Negativibacillus massiliensis]|uniref:isoprenyl transferase n=1 Tax=Negativibacillus massiliensis TaxID=1871035 RepID=UPI0009766829|nr:isoprenyl transferase [Negativibacillus massiliensis]MCI6347574.1 isoprenyl transferase [Negativibacillus massiliensis]
MANNQPCREDLPEHIGIIMDGNGRWAKKRALPRKYGHREGAKAFRKIVEYCDKIGLHYLTVYAFSTENWKRPKDEVDSIMQLLEQYIDEAFDHKNESDGVRTKFIGDMSALSPVLQEKIKRIEALGEGKSGLLVNVALNYGGRHELVHSMRALAEMVREQKIAPEEIDEAMVSDHLYTAGQPDPDLIIRPSGEERLSNFLIWQAAYSEFVFMDVLWPDFKPEHLEEAIRIFNQRHRRFGGI